MPRFEPHPDRRTAVVTGASSGHGAAIAARLAAAGHPVVVGARRVERLEELAAKIVADGGEAVAVALDLTDPDSIADFARRAEDELGPIEIVVSNAGDVQPITTLADPVEFHRQMQVNLLGAQALVHEIVPAMVARRRGDVVFVTSEVAVDPRTHMAAYVASKAGLEGFARAMAMECEGTGVRVGIVRPGPSSTEQGTTWSVDSINEVVASWSHWGPAAPRRRHPARRVRRRRAGGGVRAQGHPLRPARGAARGADRRPGGAASSESGRPGGTMTDTTTAPTGRSADIPKVSGDDGGTGHLEELRVDPIGLMQRVRDECGDVGEFRLADNDVVLLSGAEANEVFFRASDDELDQAAAYPFMTPIFGEGVVFDATPEERRRALHNQSLRDKFMRGHAATITAEIERMLAEWDDEGEIDLLDWTAELFIYTSTSCLIGPRFREELDVSVRHLFHELERGTDAIAFVDPYADIDSFRRRDAARAALVERVQGIMARRRAAGPPAEGEERDLVDVLMSIKDPDGNEHFSADRSPACSSR
jgi:NAD(P)-dependent dehydrogenase (short-subunit alcohol dehydrogenase family)